MDLSLRDGRVKNVNLVSYNLVYSLMSFRSIHQIQLNLVVLDYFLKIKKNMQCYQNMTTADAQKVLKY